MYWFKNPTCDGRLIKRRNRFVAEVEIYGQTVLAHVANSGRMRELLYPGNRVVVEEQPGEGRKTPYDLILAEYQGQLVSIDSRLPNLLIAEAITNGTLPGFAGLTVERREVTYGASRLDMKLTGEREGFVEVKSCTLVRDGVALFPDAPTERGTRHLRELVRAVQEGYLAYVVFLIQRGDASCFTPNDATDPEFGQALREAAVAGVQVRAYSCQVTGQGVEIAQPVLVRL